MTCLHNHDQILEFLRKIFLKGFQIYQNYLCALRYWHWISFVNVFEPRPGSSALGQGALSSLPSLSEETLSRRSRV